MKKTILLGFVAILPVVAVLGLENKKMCYIPHHFSSKLLTQLLVLPTIFLFGIGYFVRKRADISKKLIYLTSFVLVLSLVSMEAAGGVEDFEEFIFNVPAEHPMNYEDAISFGLDQPGGGWMFTPESSGFILAPSGGPDGSAFITRDGTINYARGFCYVVKDDKATKGVQTFEFDLLYDKVSSINADGDFAIKIVGIDSKGPSGAWLGFVDGNGGQGNFGVDYATRYTENDVGAGSDLVSDGTLLLFVTNRNDDFTQSSNWQHVSLEFDCGTGYEWICVNFGHSFQAGHTTVTDPSKKFGIDNVSLPWITPKSLNVSAKTIEKHFASHFGVLHNDAKYYHDQVELGAPWERTVVLTFDLNEIADGIRWTDREAYLAELDTFIMNAQLKGIWLMIELYVFRPIQDFQLAEEVLTTVAERYDHDGIDDMPFLKYPVKHFGVGNELAGTFKGTSQDFLAILENTHNALTNVNPEVKIVQAGLVPYHINQKDMLFWDSLFGMNVHKYIDIAVFHELQGRENFINLIFYPAYFYNQGLDRPIWINELQFENITEAPSLTQEQYAPIFIRYMTYALAHGTEKLFFANFKYPPPHIPADMPPPFTEASALIDSKDQRTILFNVVQTFIRRFDRFQSVEVIQEMIEGGEYPNRVEYIKIPVGQYKFIIDERAYYILWGESKLPEEIMGNVCVTDIFDHTVYMHSNEVILGREPIYLCLDTK